MRDLSQDTLDFRKIEVNGVLESTDEFLDRIASICKDPEHGKRIKEYIIKRWFFPSTPIASNAGTKRGLTVSCFLQYVEDSRKGISDHWAESMSLSTNGGGLGGYWGDLRSVGTKTSSGNSTTGIIPFLKVVDSEILAVSQGSTRRGSYAAYLDSNHPEIEEFTSMRSPGGDYNRKCFNLHNAVIFDDSFMEMVERRSNGGSVEKYPLIDPHSSKTIRHIDPISLWKTVLETRIKTGEPYMMFKGNVTQPEFQKVLDLEIKQSNLCITGDQRVVTSKGLKTVKELYESREDLELFDGEKVVNSSLMYLMDMGACVYTIKLENGMEHTVTGYHKVKTDNGNVACEDLKIGDRVSIQTKEGLFGDVNMPDEAFLLGMYQADGTQHKDLIFIDVWENDFDLLDEIEDRFSKVFYKYGCDTYEITNQHSKTFTRTIKPAKFHNCCVREGSHAKKRLSSNCLSKALDFKKGVIPEWIWNGDEETQWQYLRGLLYADGTAHMSKSKGNPLQISLASIDRPFLQQLQIIFANLGLQSSIRILRKAGKTLLPDGLGGHKFYDTKDCWRIIVGNKNDAQVIEAGTGFLSRKGIEIPHRKFRDNTKKFYKVSEVVYKGREDVYCVTVDSPEHLWVCNGVITSNCSEILLPTNKERTAVCVLSSVNAETFDEWKNDTLFIPDMIRFLDDVISDFYIKSENIFGMEKARNSAISERSVGLGVMGFHSYLQKHSQPFEGIFALAINKLIFQKLDKESREATEQLAKERGCCPDYHHAFWKLGDNKTLGNPVRNSFRIAVAPNSTSSLCLGVSPSIEPIVANCYSHKTSTGFYPVKNKYLEVYLDSIGKNDEDVWRSILNNEGSVSHLEFIPEEMKAVFKTAAEIDQKMIIRLAGERQQYIDQGQSVNLFFSPYDSIKYIHDVHLQAWKAGLKTLYYVRSSTTKRPQYDCIMCEG